MLIANLAAEFRTRLCASRTDRRYRPAPLSYPPVRTSFTPRVCRAGTVATTRRGLLQPDAEPERLNGRANGLQFLVKPISRAAGACMNPRAIARTMAPTNQARYWLAQ